VRRASGAPLSRLSEMTLHPILATVLVIDVVALVLVAWSAVAGMRGILGTTPSQSQPDRWRQGDPRLARVGAMLFLASSALFLVAVASVLVPAIPGARCGTGVLQAMGDAGPRALALRVLALGTLGAWSLVYRLDRRRSHGPLADLKARTMLLAAAVVLLAVVSTGRGAIALGGVQQVDCCSRVRVAATHAALLSGVPIPWTHLMVGGAVPLVALSLFLSVWRDRSTPRGIAVWSPALSALALTWTAVAATALAEQLAAYHTGRPGHACAFCLFGAGAHFAGYPLYVTLLLVAFEGTAVTLAHRVGRRTPEVGAAADVVMAMRHGASLAMESAGLVAVRDDPATMATAIRLGRRSVWIARENYLWALGYNLALIPVAALGLLHPALAALAMMLSSATVLASSARLLRGTRGWRLPACHGGRERSIMRK